LRPPVPGSRRGHDRGRSHRAAAGERGKALPAVLSGTLKQVRERGAVTIGFRAASFPFSFVKQGSAQALGYSVDLCLGIVDEIVRALNGAAIRTAYAPVDARYPHRGGRVRPSRPRIGSTTANADARTAWLSRRSFMSPAPSSW